MVLQVCHTHTPSPTCEARAASSRRLVAGGRAAASRLRHTQTWSLELFTAAAVGVPSIPQSAFQHISGRAAGAQQSLRQWRHLGGISLSAVWHQKLNRLDRDGSVQQLKLKGWYKLSCPQYVLQAMSALCQPSLGAVMGWQAVSRCISWGWDSALLYA